MILTEGLLGVVFAQSRSGNSPREGCFAVPRGYTSDIVADAAGRGGVHRPEGK